MRAEGEPCEWHTVIPGPCRREAWNLVEGVPLGAAGAERLAVCHVCLTGALGVGWTVVNDR